MDPRERHAAERADALRERDARAPIRTHTPAIEYPLDKAVAPLNIPSIDSQWTTAQNDLFHLTWTSKHIAIDLYTLQADAQFADDVWGERRGDRSGRRGRRSQSKASRRASPTTKYASALVTLNMSHDIIDKTAIYWWASSQGNIMTQTFGQTGAPTQVKGNCTSCHSVSRSGSRIGYTRCVNNDCGQLFAGFMKYDTVEQGVDRHAQRGQQGASRLVHDVLADRLPVRRRQAVACRSSRSRRATSRS